MTGYLVDTSVVIDYLKNEIPQNKLEKLESAKTSISILTVFEINKHYRNNGKINEWQNIRNELLKFNIVALNFAICEKAGELANSKGLSMADALIYASAQYGGLRLLCRDGDFDKLDRVDFI